MILYENVVELRLCMDNATVRELGRVEIVYGQCYCERTWKS